MSSLGEICAAVLHCWIILFVITPIRVYSQTQAAEASSGGPPTVYARVGDTVLLPCRQELPTLAPPLPVALYLLQWHIAGSSYPFFVVFNSQPTFTDPHYEGRVTIPSEDEASLQITNVSIADAGRLECRVTEILTSDVGGANNGSFVNLVILYTPKLLETPPPSTIFPLGDSQQLQCLAEGVPTPTISWYRGGQRLRSNRHVTLAGGNITFASVRREDGGMYVCLAENDEGSVQDTTRVIVEGAPYIFVPPHDQTVLRGQTMTFDCEYGASPSNVSQRWYHDGVLIEQRPQFVGRHATLPAGGLSVSNIAVTDEGRYSCSPTNDIGEPPVAFAHLTVQYPASVVSMPYQVFAARSYAINIPCHSDAKPPVLRYVWRKNQREILITPSSRYSVSEEGNLTIESTEFTDIGAYSCIPYNAVGTDGPSDAAILRVIEKPSFATRPKSTYELLPGERVTFPCTANGNPPPDVEWKKGENAIPRSRALVASTGLTITNLTKEDTGAYECSVTNEVATVTAVTHLYIQMTTPHLPYNISVLTSATSAYVMWYPGYNGGEEQTFTVRYKPTTMRAWSQYPHIPETVHSVLVRDLEPSTEYQFTLMGENEFGDSGWSEPILHETKEISNHSIEGIPEENPATAVFWPPRNLTVITTSEGLLLSWLPPTEGPRLVSHYAVEYWIEGPWLVLEDRVPGELTEYLLTELHVNTSYSFRMIAFSGMGFSEPSTVVTGDTWDLPIYKPTSDPQSAFDLTGLLAGVISGIFCLLCIILLACIIITCMQRRKRNKRMVFFSVVAHSDQASPDGQRKPTESTNRSPCGWWFCCGDDPEMGKKHHSSAPNITVLPSSVVTRPPARLSKTSIGGKAGVYHVSSPTQVLNTTVSGRVDIVPSPLGSEVNGSEATTDDGMHRMRLMASSDQLDGYSDGSRCGSEPCPREGRHIRFQLASSTWGSGDSSAPPKPDRGDYVYYHGCMLIGGEPGIIPPHHPSSTNLTNTLLTEHRSCRARRDTPVPRYDPDEWRRDYRMYLKPYNRSSSKDRRIVLSPSSGSEEWDGRISSYYSSDSSSPELLFPAGHFIADHQPPPMVSQSSLHTIIANHHHPSNVTASSSPTTLKTQSNGTVAFHGSDSGSQETLTSDPVMKRGQSESYSPAATNTCPLATNPNIAPHPDNNPSRSDSPQRDGFGSRWKLPSANIIPNSRQSSQLPSSRGATNASSDSPANSSITNPPALDRPIIDNVSYMLLLKPGQAHPTDSSIPESESEDDARRRRTPTEREFTTRSFDPGRDGGYDEVTIERQSSPYSHDDEHTQPSQDGDVEDNLLAYDDVPNEADRVFHPAGASMVRYDEVPNELSRVSHLAGGPMVRYDEVPMEDLQYMAEELYESLRDEMPKRKFGVHEYALDTETPEEQCPAGGDLVAVELAHEYSKLERPTAYPYADTLHGGGVPLSNDSGLNSDNSGPSEENDPDTLRSSLRHSNTAPSRHVRPLRSPRSSIRSLPRASVSPLSISTSQLPDHRSSPVPGSLPPDYQRISPAPGLHPEYQKADRCRDAALSPQDSHHSNSSSGYGSRNPTERPPSRNSGRFSSVATPTNLGKIADRSGRNSVNGPSSRDHDPSVDRGLQRYYESDGDLRGSQRRVLDLREKEEKEQRCAKLKKEFEEYRKECNSDPLSPRKTTIV